jgi:hypothetical protein
MKTLHAPIRCATEEPVTGPIPSLPAAESHHNAVSYIRSRLLRRGGRAAHWSKKLA